MNSDAYEPKTEPEELPVQAVQIICAALIFGVLMFAGVAVFLCLDKPPGNPFMAYLAAGMAVMAVVMRLVVPYLITTAPSEETNENHSDGGKTVGEESTTDSPLFILYQTRMIVGLAILEGAAFFNLIAYISSAQWWSLAVTAGLVVLMVASFPTRTRVAFWMENQRQMKQFD